ncbi:MAG: hypothetical protein AB7P03_15820 [Kofleriaceae bacterium]
MIRPTIVGAFAIAVAANVHAGPLGEAIARHSDEDVAALRAQLPGDPATRCTLGAVYARRGDLTRAMLYLDGCGDAGLPDEIRQDVWRILRDVKQRTDELARLSISSAPTSLVVEIDSLPGERLTTPVAVWVKPGVHTIHTVGGGATVTKTVTASARSYAPILIEVPVAASPSTTPGTIEFEEEAQTGGYTGPPPDVKRGSMISNKYRRKLPPGGPQLEDPFPNRSSHRTSHAIALGARVGAGMFDDPVHAMRIRPAVAAALRISLVDRLFIASRADWTRRGGMDDTAIDTLGISAGIGVTALAGSSMALAVIGQVRGDVRLVSSRDEMVIPRLGAAAAGTLELSFPATPITAGIRFEQGISELVAGMRDRALLIEMGLDLR